MKALLRQVFINDPASPHHLSRKDILIESGIIQQISDSIQEKADTEISEEGLTVSPGWVDVFADFCDPGLEYKETLESGARAAAAGGFTHAMVIPNTKPVVDAKSTVEYIVQKSANLPVKIIPIGAISKNAEGKELAEMYDMQSSGAGAFSDGLNPVQSAGMLVKALQYIKAFDGVLIQVPEDKTIAPHGLINEGIISTRLGLPGKPVMAEELIIARDIKLSRYTDSHLHFTGVTSPKSIEYISRAKAGGLKVTCSVTPYHLFFCDEDLLQYDTNLKVNPPLRTREEMMLMRKALADGQVDCIATHHMPQDYDAKVVEFEYAKNGMIGLESCYSVLKTILPEISDERWTELLSINPRKIFSIQSATIDAGQPADITLYNPSKTYQFSKEAIQSKSSNTPFIGMTLTGKVKGIIRGEKIFLNS